MHRSHSRTRPMASIFGVVLIWSLVGTVVLYLLSSLLPLLLLGAAVVAGLFVVAQISEGRPGVERLKLRGWQALGATTEWLDRVTTRRPR